MSLDFKSNEFCTPAEEITQQFDFASLRIIAEYTQNLVNDARALNNLSKDKENMIHEKFCIEKIQESLATNADPKLDEKYGMSPKDSLGKYIIHLKNKTTEYQQELYGVTFTQFPEGLKIHMILCAGLLYSIDNYLSNLKIEYNEQERKERENLSLRIEKCKEILPLFLFKKFTYKDKYGNIGKSLSETFSPVFKDIYQECFSLQKYIPYSGEIFNDINFVKGFRYANLMTQRRELDVYSLIYKITQLKKQFVPAPIDLYLTYAKSNVEKNLAQDNIKNIDAEKEKLTSQIQNFVNQLSINQLVQARNYLIHKK